MHYDGIISEIVAACFHLCLAVFQSKVTKETRYLLALVAWIIAVTVDYLDSTTVSSSAPVPSSIILGAFLSTIGMELIIVCLTQSEQLSRRSFDG